MSTDLDVPRAEALAVRAAKGDAAAAQELVGVLWPEWLKVVRATGAMRGLRDSDDDHVYNVLVRLVEKIGSPHAAALKLYEPWRARHADKTFADWNRIVAVNTARDYARSIRGSGTSVEGHGEVSVKRLLNEFSSTSDAENVGARPPITANQTARELIEFAVAHLEDDQLRALELWLEGQSFDEIGVELALDPDGAQRALRAAVATLRRQFGR